MNQYLKPLSGLCLLLGSKLALAGMPSTIITINFTSNPVDVPLLSSPMLLVMGLLLFVASYRLLKNPAASKFSAFLVVGLALLTSSFGGLKLIEDAHATGNSLELSDNGTKTSYPVNNGGSFPIENSTGLPQRITSILMTNQGSSPGQCDQNTGGGSDPNPGIPDCNVGDSLKATAGDRNIRSCEVRVTCTPGT